MLCIGTKIYIDLLIKLFYSFQIVHFHGISIDILAATHNQWNHFSHRPQQIISPFCTECMCMSNNHCPEVIIFLSLNYNFRDGTQYLICFSVLPISPLVKSDTISSLQISLLFWLVAREFGSFNFIRICYIRFIWHIWLYGFTWKSLTKQIHPESH